MLERPYDIVTGVAPANRVATADRAPAEGKPWTKLAFLFAFFGVVFSVWPQIDIIIAKAVRVETGSEFFQPIANVRAFFKTLFAATSLLVVACALPLLAGGAFRERLWSTAALFVSACFVVGPGLITNVLLKGMWGRARPIQIAELGGDKIFSAALWPSDQCAWNCSFVSGEAASIFMLGFALAALFPSWRRTALAIGCVSGLASGIVRMAQGGHFASDVIFAGLIMAATAFTLRYVLIDQPMAPLRDLRRLGDDSIQSRQ